MKTELIITVTESKTLSGADIRDITRFAEAEGLTPNDFIAAAIEAALHLRRQAHSRQRDDQKTGVP